MVEGLTGWLDPLGVFHPCEYGEHNEYAMDELERMKGIALSPYQSHTAIQEMYYIPMSGGEKGYVFLHIDKGTNKPIYTEEQLAWFKEHFKELTEQQQEMVSDWIPELEGCS